MNYEDFSSLAGIDLLKSIHTTKTLWFVVLVALSSGVRRGIEEGVLTLHCLNALWASNMPVRSAYSRFYKAKVRQKPLPNGIYIWWRHKCIYTEIIMCTECHERSCNDALGTEFIYFCDVD